MANRINLNRQLSCIMKSTITLMPAESHVGAQPLVLIGLMPFVGRILASATLEVTAEHFAIEEEGSLRLPGQN